MPRRWVTTTSMDWEAGVRPRRQVPSFSGWFSVSVLLFIPSVSPLTYFV